MTTTPTKPWLPPRWFIASAWRVHRFLFLLTGGKRPLRAPRRGGGFGMLRLRTTGRRTGEERAVILGYFEDDARYVTLAMNGWGDPAPAWWLNLQAHPDAAVDTVDGPRLVRGREVEGAERERLWAAFADYSGWGDDISRYAGLRSRQTPVVVLEPRNT